ncbi:MAG: PTS transporter subunit EIIC [Selenomonadaceae bacterium]|nr:PTS transporter subunit EIIC [Selenomonadaceae bacterium]
MTPVAVLPAAGLLLRLGAEDVFNIEIISKAGGAIFENLPALFAIGIAFGITKDNHGSAALSGYVGYIILTALLKIIDSSINMGVLAGIVSGLTAGTLYNRYHNIKLPDYLGFFGGTRFIPIVTSFVMIFFALILGNIWLPIQSAIQSLGDFIINAGIVGTFIYGFLNRLLIPFGLHHVLNSFIWFVFGEYTNPVTGAVVTGDINRFFAGDPTAGSFLAGFFPVMMFGLPAVCLAIYKTAKVENKEKISGALLSIALTSFLTGITEPIEFAFMFLAPKLYLLHAVLTGLSLAVCNCFGVFSGFGFSAGLIDFVLNWGITTHPERIIPIGLVFAAIYYFVFSWAIVKFNLPTMGRYDEEISDDENISTDEKTLKFIENLGGKDNFVEISNCATRLRLTLKDAEKINEEELKKLGAMGIVKKGNAVQVIVGTQAEHIANDIREVVRD